MLILKRKEGEKIIIGDDIKVVIISLYGNHVRLGIEAGKNVSIWREELYLKIKKEI